MKKITPVMKTKNRFLKLMTRFLTSVSRSANERIAGHGKPEAVAMKRYRHADDTDLKDERRYYSFKCFMTGFGLCDHPTLSIFWLHTN